MERKRGRPKGAGDRKYLSENTQLGVVMAGLVIRDPGLSVWQAAIRVAPEAEDFNGEATHQGRVPRRLHAFYMRNESRLKTLAHACLYPPPPYTWADLAREVDKLLNAIGIPPESIPEGLANSLRLFRSLDDHPCMQDAARRRELEDLLQDLRRQVAQNKAI